MICIERRIEGVIRYKHGKWCRILASGMVYHIDYLIIKNIGVALFSVCFVSISDSQTFFFVWKP